jgi:hypothetical protein
MTSRPPPGAGQAVVLYRAVSPTELEDILAHHSYRVPSGLEGKYFYDTIEQARRFPELLAATGYSVTSASFSVEALESADRIEVAGEGVALWLPAEVFPVGPVTVEPHA